MNIAPRNVPEIAGEYNLIDSGNEMKLEQIGKYRIVRPAPQAVWTPRLPDTEWRSADATYVRSSSGGGEWKFKNPTSRKFQMLYDNIGFEIKLTDFGHLGLFPEQAHNWQWLREVIRTRMAYTNNANLNVLNLFAYTGGSTLACSQAGAHVVHLDAAKGVVDWARDNAKFSHLHDRPIRWIVDDALKFVAREARRKNRYHGIILDPPSFGRGPKGEVFKIENDLLPLLAACKEILANDAAFVLLSCHTPGFTPLTLHNELLEMLGDRPGNIESDEMIVAEQDRINAPGRLLPSGAFARWQGRDVTKPKKAETKK